jgi:hypothetical protein
MYGPVPDHASTFSRLPNWVALSAGRIEHSRRASDGIARANGSFALIWIVSALGAVIVSTQSSR